MFKMSNCALERNNQNTGGAYIDKNPNAYSIRSEGLVKTLEEINQIVAKESGSGVPILIRDVTKAQFGHGVRYGAATRNGQGETVTGIVMMLNMIPRNMTFYYLNLMLFTNTAYQFPHPFRYHPQKNFLPIFRYPDNMILTIIRGMRRFSIILHTPKI